MTDSVDTYFDAWNESDAAARRELLERCLNGDVELVDENGRFRGYDGISALIAGFHEKLPGGRVVKSSSIDEFDGIARYSWDIVSNDGNTVMVGLDVVERDTDGRLQRIIMFHRPLPPLSRGGLSGHI
jgi:SnoaL-like domain